MLAFESPVACFVRAQQYVLRSTCKIIFYRLTDSSMMSTQSTGAFVPLVVSTSECNLPYYYQ